MTQMPNLICSSDYDWFAIPGHIGKRRANGIIRALADVESFEFYSKAATEKAIYRSWVRPIAPEELEGSESEWGEDTWYECKEGDLGAVPCMVLPLGSLLSEKWGSH